MEFKKMKETDTYQADLQPWTKHFQKHFIFIESSAHEKSSASSS